MQSLLRAITKWTKVWCFLGDGSIGTLF